jgi:hypothetical protein
MPVGIASLVTIRRNMMRIRERTGEPRERERQNNESKLEGAGKRGFRRLRKEDW